MTLLNALLPCFLLSLPAHAADPGPLSARVEAVASPEPGADAVIAYLGRRVIRYGDFSAWLQRMEGPRAKRLRANPDSRAQAVRQFLDLQVLAAKGRLEQVQRTRAFRSQFALAEQQCCVKVLLDEDRPGSDGQKLKAEAEAPTETELQACFADHRERFAIPERFTVRQILVRLKGGLGAKGGGLPEPEARAKLGYIQEALKAGQSFEALARDYSDDPGSRANGGLYQDIPFGRFPRAF